MHTKAFCSLSPTLLTKYNNFKVKHIIHLHTRSNYKYERQKYFITYRLVPVTSKSNILKA